MVEIPLPEGYEKFVASFSFQGLPLNLHRRDRKREKEFIEEMRVSRFINKAQTKEKFLQVLETSVDS